MAVYSLSNMIAVIIPIYNHPHHIDTLCKNILQYKEIRRIILVNDGSDQFCTTLLRKLAQHKMIKLIEHPQNLGKGAAVLSGLHQAQAMGYSHALQIDADGQHDISAMDHFLLASQLNPKAFIIGYPKYDQSVPTIRLLARYLTHIWVWINTLSFDIKDSMCGFRLYPVTSVLDLANTNKLGKRMDFDTEILVKSNWAGGKMINLPVKVTYPQDGRSHFRLWQDNYLITCMHIKLFFGMLVRLPKLIVRKIKGH